MKYIITAYASQHDYDGLAGKPNGDRWTPEQLAAMTAFMDVLNKRLEESGELIETRGLAAPVHARRVQLRRGVPVVTDGPYAETDEVLASYWVVECDSFDRATEIAVELATCPGPEDLRARAVADVRPIVDSLEDLGI